MKFIGLTGGIGSGKSTVAGLFRTLGIPVFESDVRAKHLMHADESLRKEIVSLFGVKAYADQNELNRPWIASQVFSEPALLHKLNAIVHPAVLNDLLNWANEEDQRNAPYLVQESAIIFEENLTQRMAAVILVVAPEHIRIERVMHRDGVSREDVQDRIKNQWPDEKKIPGADYVIYNDGQRSLIYQVLAIDGMIRQQENPD